MLTGGVGGDHGDLLAYAAEQLRPLAENGSADTEELRLHCRICDPTRSKRTSLAYNTAKGVARCHRCDFSGNAKETLRHFGLEPPAATVRSPTSSRSHTYHDENGEPLFRVSIRKYDDGERRSWTSHWTGKGWRKGLGGKRKVLYRLHDLRAVPKGKIVYVVEGEKDVDTLQRHGFHATSAPFGATAKWLPSYTRELAGHDLVIIPDDDDAGRAHAAKVARAIDRRANSVRILELPDLPEGGDASDFLKDHETVELHQLTVGAKPWRDVLKQWRKEGKLPKGTKREARRPKRKSQSTVLLELAESAGVELLRDDDEAYASLVTDGHRETHRVRSRTFRLWLSRLYHSHESRVPSARAVSDALGVLEGGALFGKLEEAVHVRVAGLDGRVYLDIADGRWRAVEVDADGWRVVGKPPVRFVRPKGVLPLPEPESGGSVDDLWGLVNVRDEDQRLLIAWLVQSFMPRGPYPTLVFCGQPGSAKTTSARVLRGLVDPNACPIRSEPREVRDMLIAAKNSWMLCLDNLSHLSGWLSDALCRLATGGGISTRELYSDGEEVLLDAQRPALLTGIEELARNEDLVDRALLLYVDRVEARRTERELQSKFERARPRLLGALLDRVADALRELPRVNVPAADLARMADFSELGAALEVAVKSDQKEFHKAYRSNREAARAVVVDSEPVARPLLEMLETKDKWAGTATELLDKLNEKADEQVKRAKRWPKLPQFLSGRVRRLEQTLEEHGWRVDFNRDSKNKSRQIEFSKVSEADSPSRGERVHDEEADSPSSDELPGEPEQLEFAPPAELETISDGPYAGFRMASGEVPTPDPKRAELARLEVEQHRRRGNDARAP